MKGEATVLIVGENPARTSTWRDWLERAGYSTLICPGPTLTPCPRLGAARCALREIADVAVVEVQGPGEAHPYGEWHEHACTRLPDDGTTIFVSDEGTQGMHHPLTAVGLIAGVERFLGSEAVGPQRLELCPPD